MWEVKIGHSPPRSVIAFEQASINNNVSAGVKRRVEIESPVSPVCGLNGVARELPFLSMVPGRRRVRCGASVVVEEDWSFDLDFKPNCTSPSLSLPLSDVCTSSGNLGADGEMVEGMASNLPSRSEGSEVRLAERDVVDPPSSPFLRPKTFDKKEGIAACPGGERPRVEWSEVGVCSNPRFLRPARRNFGDGLTDREAEEEDELKVDGRRSGSGSPVRDVEMTEGEEERVSGHAPPHLLPPEFLATYFSQFRLLPRKKQSLSYETHLPKLFQDPLVKVSPRPRELSPHTSLRRVSPS